MCNFYENYSKEELEKIKIFLLENNHYLGEFLFSKHFPQIYKDILRIQFPFEIKKFSQKLYHFFNMDIDKWNLGLCKICGKRCNFRNFSIGYLSYCCCKCAGSDKEVKEKNKNTNISLYGEDYAKIRAKKSLETKSKFTKEKWNEINDKIKLTKFERYGDENFNNNLKQQETMNIKYGGVGFSSDIIMKKYKKTMEEKYNDINYRNNKKHNETCLDLYGVEHYSQTEEWKEKSKKSSFERYGVEFYTQTEECRKKSYQTKKKNNSFHSSKIEEQLKEYFNNNDIYFISYHKTDKYPFECDFYLPNYDLYIEINGHWTHGKHPFNPNNKEDVELLEEWKSKSKIVDGKKNQYFNGVLVWSQRDPLKRQTAKENNLNYLEIFSDKFDECKNIINNYINNNLLCQK